MPGLTNYVRYNTLNVLLGTAFSGVGSLYVGLFTTNPTDDGTFGGTTDEVEWSCPREVVAQSSHASNPYILEEEDTVTSNGGRRLRLVNELTWSGATTTTYLTGGDELVIGGGIYTASTAGTLLAWGPLATNLTVSASDEVVFATSTLMLTMRKVVY